MLSNPQTMFLIGTIALLGGVQRATADTSCDDDITPWTLNDGIFQPVLSISELQAPDSATDWEDLTDFCNDNFYVSGDYVRFITFTGEERSELRIPNKNEFAGDTTSTEYLEGTVSLQEPEFLDHYTFMQIHSTISTVNPGGALVKLAARGYRDEDYGDDLLTWYDWLWADVRTGIPSDYDTGTGDDWWFPLAPRPTGDFFVKIQISDSTLSIWTGDDDDTPEFTATVSWAGEDCYFKAGTYLQDGTNEKYYVDYKTLTYSGTYAA